MGCVISEPEEDMSLNFLVILKKSDFSKTIKCCNRKNQIKRTLQSLPGNVKITKFDETKLIKGLKMPYVLYTKLPKENIYVTSDIWDIEYFNSQVLELIQIFTALGAKEIKFDSNKKYDNTFSIESNLKLTNIPIKLASSVEHTESHNESNSFGGYIKIKTPNKKVYKSLDEFIENNQLYYTKFYPEWKSLILYKMHNDIDNINFEYSFQRGFHCGTNLSVDIEKIGISCKLVSAENNSTTLGFSVTY